MFNGDEKLEKKFKMKAKIFFAILLIVFCVIHILFIDDRNHIDFWSFVPPFSIWLSFYIFYLSGGYGSALAQSKAIRGEYVIDSETEDFDEMLRKRREGKNYVPRRVLDERFFDSESDLCDEMLKIKRERDNSTPPKQDDK